VLDSGSSNEESGVARRRPQRRRPRKQEPEANGRPIGNLLFSFHFLKLLFIDTFQLWVLYDQTERSERVLITRLRFKIWLALHIWFQELNWTIKSINNGMKWLISHGFSERIECIQTNFSFWFQSLDANFPWCKLFCILLVSIPAPFAISANEPNLMGEIDFMNVINCILWFTMVVFQQAFQ